MDLPPFNEFLGVRVESAREGEATCAIDLEPHHTNKHTIQVQVSQKGYARPSGLPLQPPSASARW